MLTDADHRAIEATIERYRQAVLDQDWSAWGETLSPDVFLSPPHQPPRAGRESAVAWVADFPTVTRFGVGIQEIHGAGNIAYVRGRYELDFVMPDGSEVDDAGVFLQIHERADDKAWLYRELVFHSIRPAP